MQIFVISPYCYIQLLDNSPEGPKHVGDAIKQLENPSHSVLISFLLTAVRMDLGRMFFLKSCLESWTVYPVPRVHGFYLDPYNFNDIGRACCIYGEEERCMQGFCGET